MADSNHSTNYNIKTISATETYVVRHPILRQGRPIESCVMEGDLNDDTVHIGIFDGHSLIGVLSLMAKKHPNFNVESQFQLRGMAILVPYQHKGLGRLLVTYAEKHLNTEFGNPFIWLNAREKAKEFYLKLGYEESGKPFYIEPIGSHYLMKKQL